MLKIALQIILVRCQISNYSMNYVQLRVEKGTKTRIIPSNDFTVNKYSLEK